MSRTFYPSDEYDSEELERASMKRRVRQWLGKHWRHDDDDDDDPPLSPVTGRIPKPTPPLVEAAAQAA
jgi:hypothetical protein